MKKNRLFVLGIITMFVAILSLTLVSGTMARYTSSVSATDTAKAAKWAFVVNEEDVVNETAEVFTIDLFKATEIYNVGTSTNDENVKDGTTVAIIAPGTQGKFAIEITNESEVSAKYTIQLEEVGTSNIPLEYSSDGSTWNSSLTAVVGELLLTGEMTKTETLQWRWAFGAEGVDNQFGLEEVEVTVKITITFDQIN